MNKRTKNMVIAALMAALACVATMLIKIPSPLKGYLNLGDCIVLVTGWILSPANGFLAAGLGSAMADLFSGYMTYVPATFLIKGTMALAAGFLFRILSKRGDHFKSRIISGVVAEVIMVIGYYVFESFLYGGISSLVNIPANAVQGVAGLVIGIVLMKGIEKSKIVK